MGNHCRKCSSPDTHMKAEDKDRIQYNVRDCTDQYREHAFLRKALRCDKCIHAKSQLNKDRSECIDIHIGCRVLNRVCTCSKSEQEIPVPDQQNYRQNNG